LTNSALLSVRPYLEGIPMINGLVVATAKRFYRHLLTRNAEDNVQEIVQTAHMLILQGQDERRAVSKACYIVSSQAGHHITRTGWKQRVFAMPEFFSAEKNLRVILRSPGEIALARACGARARAKRAAKAALSIAA